MSTFSLEKEKVEPKEINYAFYYYLLSRHLAAYLFIGGSGFSLGDKQIEPKSLAGGSLQMRFASVASRLMRKWV
ncbi:MAG: hypothetical protein ACOYJD_08045 [Christensenellales bacterium]